MVYKITCLRDMTTLEEIQPCVRTLIEQYVRTLSTHYGEHRDVDADDGGYLLYLSPGTAMESVKEIFDYTSYPLEYLTLHQDTIPPLCAAHYILNNEYTVTIVMTVEDMPDEWLNEIEGEFL